MGRPKRILAGTAGIAIGVVTLQKLRARRRDPRQEAETAAKDALTEAAKAAEHSAASIEHARTAGQKTVEAASDELEQVRESVGGSAPEPRAESRRRPWTAATQWIRR